MSRRPVVVDTNVLVVANGRNTHANDACQLDSVRALVNVRANELALLDSLEMLLDEYANNVNRSGEPGVGDEFFAHLFNHQYDAKFVARVPIERIVDASRGFEELPPNELKRGDRVVLAIAIVGQAPILNATDSDWEEQSVLLGDLGIEVRQLCPLYATRRGRGRNAPKR